MMALPKATFSGVLFAFQLLLLGLFAGYAKYDTSARDVNNIYPQFQDVHVMMFFGFAFLMTFLKKYGYSALTYNFLVCAVVIQWATLLNQWISKRILKEKGHFDGDPNEVTIGITQLLTSDFTAAAVLITFGAVIGKVCRLQLLIIAIIECIFFAVNEAVILEFLHISDVGGSIVVHLFGAYFGLAVAFVIRKSGDEHPKESATKTSDLFSMAGTIFLWMYWPSFNSGGLTDQPERQIRAVVNTYFALAACVVTTLVVSPLVSTKYKISMVHIQNATLAGGVAVGTSADLMINPWGAIFIGMIAAVVSTLGYAYATPFLCSKLKIHDTCGVNNLHGMPAILAAVFAAIAAPAIDLDKYSNDINRLSANATGFGNIYSEVASGARTANQQGGFQFAAAVVAFAFAVVGGLITGVIIKQMNGIENEDDLYDDDREFEVLEDVEANIHSNGNDIPMKKTHTDHAMAGV